MNDTAYMRTLNIFHIKQLLTGDEGNIWFVGPEDKMLPEAEGRGQHMICLKVQHIICCPHHQSIIVLLYLHLFRVTYSIQNIHNQTDHDQTGLNLDELIWDELALVWINSYTITPVHVIQVANNKLTQLGTNWLRTEWIQNESTCLWRQMRHSGPTSVLCALGPTLIFICPLLLKLTIGII